jgi:hypothetical protein
MRMCTLVGAIVWSGTFAASAEPGGPAWVERRWRRDPTPQGRRRRYLLAERLGVGGGKRGAALAVVTSTVNARSSREVTGGAPITHERGSRLAGRGRRAETGTERAAEDDADVHVARVGAAEVRRRA